MKNGNNLGLVLGTNVKFYISVAKGLKLKVKKFLGLILTFVEVIEEKLIKGEEGLCPPSPPPILNRVEVTRNTFTLLYFCVCSNFI